MSTSNGQDLAWLQRSTQNIKRPVNVLELALCDDGTPIPGSLIQTSDGANILIDTGYQTDKTFLSRLTASIEC